MSSRKESQHNPQPEFVGPYVGGCLSAYYTDTKYYEYLRNTCIWSPSILVSASEFLQIHAHKLTNMFVSNSKLAWTCRLQTCSLALNITQYYPVLPSIARYFLVRWGHTPMQASRQAHAHSLVLGSKLTVFVVAFHFICFDIPSRA